MKPRGVLTQELIIANKSYKSLKKQHKFLIDNGEELYKQYFLFAFTGYGRKRFNSLNDFREQMGLYSMIESIKINVRKLVELGYKTNYRVHKNDMARYQIDFNIDNPYVDQYMQQFSNIQLSDVKGSIPFTTKNHVIQILKDGIANNESYTEVAKKIAGLDSFLFSQERAKLIAVREMGLAYEFGNRAPMDQLRRQGAIIEKKWSTVGDDKVTFECSANQKTGRVSFDHVYLYDGDDLTPRSGNPRCRCTMLWKIK